MLETSGRITRRSSASVRLVVDVPCPAHWRRADRRRRRYVRDDGRTGPRTENGRPRRGRQSRHRAPRSSTKVAGYRQGKLLKRFERVPVARHQAANSVLYEGKRTEAIILQLKEPIWMSECFSAAAEKHWLELRGHCRNFIPPGAGNQTAGLEHLTFMAKQEPQ
jgi:hypothetical protein